MLILSSIEIIRIFIEITICVLLFVNIFLFIYIILRGNLRVQLKATKISAVTYYRKLNKMLTLLCILNKQEKFSEVEELVYLSQYENTKFSKISKKGKVGIFEKIQSFVNDYNEVNEDIIIVRKLNEDLVHSKRVFVMKATAFNKKIHLLPYSLISKRLKIVDFYYIASQKS